MHADYVTTDDVVVYDEQSYAGKNRRESVHYTHTHIVHTHNGVLHECTHFYWSVLHSFFMVHNIKVNVYNSITHMQF